MNLNIIAKKGINSLNCCCHSSSAHTLRNTQSCSLKAGVKYSRHNSFLLWGWRGFWAAVWRQAGETLSLWKNFFFFFFFIAMMIIDCVPTALGAELALADASGGGRGHKGSLWAGAGIGRWSETKIRTLAKWLLAGGDSVLKVDQIWRPREGTENSAIFKTATSKVRSSSKLEAEVEFRQMWEPGCPRHQSLGISLQTEIKCQNFHREQIPSLHCHFPFSPLSTSGNQSIELWSVRKSFIFISAHLCMNRHR